MSEEEQTRYDVTSVPVRDDHSRDTDQEPFYGGVRMWPNTSGGDNVDHVFCTAGFTMLRSGVRYLSSAGHCGEYNNFYTTLYSNYIGWDSVNPYEDDTTAHDVMLIRGKTYTSPIWYGAWNTGRSDYVTNKYIDGPGVGHEVFMSGGRSGLQGGVVTDAYDPESGCGSVVQVTFYTGDYAQRGDSGAPWSSRNTFTGRTDDVKAAGVHNCSDDPGIDDTYAWFPRIGLVEDWTGSSVVMSSP